jgi:stringent starvation protein B
MKPHERLSKRDAFFAFFGKGSVFVYLDARRNGVKVPPEFSDNRQLLLQYGENMPIPIPDLLVNDEGISATLSFSRMPHRTFVPWSAVYMIETEGHRILYYKDVPEDVAIVARPVSAETGDAFGPPGALVELQGDDEDGVHDSELGEDEGVGTGEAEGAGADAGARPDAPAGEGARAGGAAAAGTPERAGKGKPGKRPARRAPERLLKSVPAEPEPESGAGVDAPEEPATAATRRRKRPQLRVVK